MSPAPTSAVPYPAPAAALPVPAPVAPPRVRVSKLLLLTLLLLQEGRRGGGGGGGAVSRVQDSHLRPGEQEQE